MKFTKPINREVEIDGQNFILSFDITGIEFRLKGKRKTARVSWPQVLDIARGEDGESARALLGIDAAASAQSSGPAQAQNEDALAQTINPPAPAPQSQSDGSAQEPPSTPASSNESSLTEQSQTGENTEPGDAQSRAVTARETGPES